MIFLQKVYGTLEMHLFVQTIQIKTSISQCKTSNKYVKINITKRKEKVLENPQVIKTSVVRNRKQSTLEYQPDVWKKWN